MMNIKPRGLKLKEKHPNYWVMEWSYFILILTEQEKKKILNAILIATKDYKMIEIEYLRISMLLFTHDSVNRSQLTKLVTMLKKSEPERHHNKVVLEFIDEADEFLAGIKHYHENN